jgi:hypothetical protein
MARVKSERVLPCHALMSFSGVWNGNRFSRCRAAAPVPTFTVADRL